MTTNSLDIGLAFTFSLVIIVLTFSQGQAKTCDLTSRPHPRGTCGSQLSEMHSRLCFILRRAFPEYFPAKRAVATGYDNTAGVPAKKAKDTVLEHIYNAPLSALAARKRGDGTQDGALFDWDTSGNYWAKSGIDEDVASPEAFPSHDAFKGVTSALYRTLNKKMGGPHKRSAAIHKRSLVCDCCYNVCTAHEMATYC